MRGRPVFPGAAPAMPADPASPTGNPDKELRKFLGGRPEAAAMGTRRILRRGYAGAHQMLVDQEWETLDGVPALLPLLLGVSVVFMPFIPNECVRRVGAAIAAPVVAFVALCLHGILRLRIESRGRKEPHIGPGALHMWLCVNITCATALTLLFAAEALCDDVPYRYGMRVIAVLLLLAAEATVCVYSLAHFIFSKIMASYERQFRQIISCHQFGDEYMTELRNQVGDGIDPREVDTKRESLLAWLISRWREQSTSIFGVFTLHALAIYLFLHFRVLLAFSLAMTALVVWNERRGTAKGYEPVSHRVLWNGSTHTIVEQVDTGGLYGEMRMRHGGVGEVFRAFGEMVYLNFVTFATVGYGDMYPRNQDFTARLIVCLQLTVWLIMLLMGLNMLIGLLYSLPSKFVPEPSGTAGATAGPLGDVVSEHLKEAVANREVETM